VVARRYIPERGDLVWLQFDVRVDVRGGGHTGGESAGREQSGRHPALVISPKAYNKKVGLGLFCPVTSRIKGYPYEVVLPETLPIAGAILSDQIKSLDWRARAAERIGRAPEDVVDECLSKIETLVRGVG
jgi:mRNA interferase MazF